MSNSASAATAKPSSSVKLVLLGEAAVGKVSIPILPQQLKSGNLLQWMLAQGTSIADQLVSLRFHTNQKADL